MLVLGLGMVEMRSLGWMRELRVKVELRLRELSSCAKVKVCQMEISFHRWVYWAKHSAKAMRSQVSIDPVERMAGLAQVSVYHQGREQLNTYSQRMCPPWEALLALA